MKPLIDTLKNYANTVPLETRFKYDFDLTSHLFTKQEKFDLGNEENSFKRNVQLKELIKRKSKGLYSQSDLNFWIINNWGGIKTFKNNADNLLKIDKFSQQIFKNKLTRDTFSTISSLSKIASFVDPENYLIYDSRVIYTLNWLILTTLPNDTKFFPMPPSRNRKLVDFDLNTIIRFVHLKRFQNKEQLFYDPSTAYFKYCSLIKTLSLEIFPGTKLKPYYLEMLLFTIADSEVYNEVATLTSIKINNLQLN